MKPFICLVFVLFSASVNAQVASVKQIIDKMESYKNFSYRSVNRQKELFTSDTITEQYHTTFEKAPGDKNWGYLFNMETLDKNDKVTATDLYNGQNLVHTDLRDTTYNIQDAHAFVMMNTLPGCLKWLKGRLEKRSSTVIKTSDTTINTVDSYHLIANVYDSVINKERNYTYVDLCVDKLSGMPDCLIIRSRNTTYGDGVSTYYSETRYSDYKFDEGTVNIASMTIPKWFHLPKAQPTLPKVQTDLLTVGSVAPGWTLYTANGKKTSLTQLKGKVVLMDFYFIGCFPCMLSLKPLNKLYEKYKGKNFEIVSINRGDSRKSVLEFEKNYHTKYPGYINAADVVKSYHVKGFPTFYFINKEGKIANVDVGYDDDFEEKTTAIIEGLLRK